MSPRRTLILDEDDLVMVVDKGIVKQVDENRGEMTRTEFVNFLIQNQLKDANRNYVDKEQYHRFTLEIKKLLSSFLDFMLTLELAKEAEQDDFEQWYRKVQALDSLNSGEQA